MKGLKYLSESTLVRMAANGITLKPVRMGDLVTSGTKPGGKYVPPSRRQNPEESMAPATAEINMSEENFPTLGSRPKEAPVWGKNPVKTSSTEPMAIGPSLSDKIKEKLRLDAIAEEERVRGGETDVWKMTPAQLEAEGWICLPLKSSRNVTY